MKITLLLLRIQLLAISCCLLFNKSFAQTNRKADVIFLRNESKLEVLIQEVNDREVKYKKITDQEGPLFAVKKSEIASIHYGNGEIETFEATLEVPNYYNPGQQQANQNPPAPIERRPGIPLTKKEQQLEEIRTSSAEHLRASYKYYRTRSKNGLAIGIAGMSAGFICMGVGTGMIVGATDANGNFATYQDEQRAIRGAQLLLGGFVGAATFGTIGFVKAGRNGARASRIRRELLKRGEPIAVRLTPAFDPLRQAAYLSLKVSF